MQRETCGYRGLGHYCAEGRVQFISRYRGSNDYCVDGRRVTLHEDGTMFRQLDGDRERIRQFEQDKYKEYLKWHSEQIVNFGASWPSEPLPFNCKA